MNAHTSNQDASSTGASQPNWPRPPHSSELHDQIVGLHQLTQRRAATASPLGRQLMEMARNGTYDRLAPVVAAADPEWQHESPVHDQSRTDPDTSNHQPAEQTAAPTARTPWKQRVASVVSKIHTHKHEKH